jgi:hypothetical protein
MEKLMAPDPRDLNFDKALARHFRPAEPSEEPANLPAELGLQADNCPDAESLAAYHERSLLPAEMNSWKEHIVGCAHCQMVLAELEATDNIPLHHAETAESPAMNEAKPAAVIHPWPAADATPSHKTRMVRSTRRRWRWLVPAGAIAAGLLVWISLHENQQQTFPSLEEAKVAKKQQPPTPPSSMVSRAPTARLTQPNPPAAADEIAASNGAIGEGSLKQREKAQISPKLTAPTHSADKENDARESGARKDELRDSSVPLNGRANQADLDAKIAAGRPQQNVEVQSQSAPVPNYQYNAKVPGPAPLSQAQAPARKKSEANAPVPAAPSASAGVAGGVAAVTTSNQIGAASETVMVISDPHMIFAPGSNSQWRTGPSGLIEFSSNGGSSWLRQRSGVLVELLTGSAPSDKICWIVGRVGAIVLTTDGGATWKLISSPLKEDLGGVQASDALHARVWNSLNTKSFETSDGGVTWKRFVNE